MVEIILLHWVLGTMLSDMCQGLCPLFMFHLLQFALWPSCAVNFAWLGVASHWSYEGSGLWNVALVGKG